MVKATTEQVEDGTNGGCTSCGHVQEGGVEPDAREYECEECGEKKVYGLEELIVMNELELVDEDEEGTSNDVDIDRS